MKPDSSDHERLLNDILSDEKLTELRSASFEKMLVEARRFRQGRRTTITCIGYAAVFVLAALFLTSHQLFMPRQNMAHVDNRSIRMAQSFTIPTPTPNPAPESRVTVLTDDELLSLFPGRPIALIGPPGKREFVFLDRLPHPRSPAMGDP